jgi:alpha-1,2-mannosyltransferase
MYQVLTVFPYPVAAWVWLLILLAIMAYSTHLLVRIAGYSGWKTTLAVLPFTVTFGPTFLNLTIGQNGPVVLLGALLLGRYLHGQARPGSAMAGWVVAVAAKIYPVLWITLLLFVRRWRMAVILGLVCILLFGVVAILERDADRDYWFNYLLQRGREVTGDVFVDDQSLSARIELLGRTNRMGLHGLDVDAREEIVWSPPWDIPGRTLRIVSLVIIIGLGAVVLRTWLVADRDRFSEGLLYLVVLFSLLPIPHMERYNHVALLPAMAWLWRRGPKYRFLTVLAYCLAGLSRLNHLWAAILHWPLGPLATGTCMYAVLILGAGIIHVARQGSLTRLDPTG